MKKRVKMMDMSIHDVSGVVGWCLGAYSEVTLYPKFRQPHTRSQGCSGWTGGRFVARPRPVAFTKTHGLRNQYYKRMLDGESNVPVGENKNRWSPFLGFRTRCTTAREETAHGAAHGWALMISPLLTQARRQERGSRPVSGGMRGERRERRGVRS